jgi:hypothetical protein
MLDVLITLTPGRSNELIDCQKANVRIAVLLLRGEVSSKETFQILCRSESNDGHGSYLHIHLSFFQEVVIV